MSIAESSESERADDHLGERRVPAVRLVERREADEAVHAALGLQHAVRVLSRDREGRRLEAGLLPRRGLEELGLEPAPLGPAEVHAQEHLPPVLRVGPPFPRVDRDDRVARVVLAGEERLLLQPVELQLQARDALGHLVQLAVVRGERDELVQVGRLLREAVVALAPAREARVLGRDLCRLLLVVPEAGRGHGLLELAELGCSGHPGQR